ncbi:MAG: HPr(Ser) kinase/phosphatase [Granulosicoccus sp.]
MPHLTVRDAFNQFHKELGFTWAAGLQGGDRRLTRDAESGRRARLLGPLNFNSPNRIQLLGAAEIRLFGSRKDLDPSRFEYALANTCELFVTSGGLPAPAPIIALAEAEHIPVFISTLPYTELQKTMRARLTQHLAERRIIHGVMMDVLGTGVLITGDASVGKSELALELISRGHILVADDAPEFSRIAPGTLECNCPDLLQDFLEVRGLGILNIARMYGNAHTRRRKILRFIVHLRAVTEDALQNTLAEVAGDRISEPQTHRSILGVDIPERTIPVAPGRNLAVLVEAAVRDEILRAGGYSASAALVSKQAEALIGDTL